MYDVYELYGSQAADIQAVRALLSKSSGLSFEYHESYYKGKYFLAHGPSGQELTIESNEISDEEGLYFKEDDFSEYRTLIRLQYSSPAQIDDGPAPDELSGRLSDLEGIILLQRNFIPADK